MGVLKYEWECLGLIRLDVILFDGSAMGEVDIGHNIAAKQVLPFDINLISKGTFTDMYVSFKQNVR